MARKSHKKAAMKGSQEPKKRGPGRPREAGAKRTVIAMRLSDADCEALAAKAEGDESYGETAYRLLSKLLQA